MSKDQPADPEFRSDDAVLPAPSMVPASTQDDSGGSVARAGIHMSFFCCFTAIGIAALLTLDLRRDSAWWAGLFLGVSTVVAAHFVLQFARHGLLRWELRGTTQLKLTAPKWLRLLVAATEVVGTAAFCAWFVVGISNANGELDFLRGSAAMLAASMAIIRTVIEQLNAWDLEPGVFR